jgi:hypothetical protein
MQAVQKAKRNPIRVCLVCTWVLAGKRLTKPYWITKRGAIPDEVPEGIPWNYAVT